MKLKLSLFVMFIFTVSLINAYSPGPRYICCQDKLSDELYPYTYCNNSSDNFDSVLCHYQEDMFEKCENLTDNECTQIIKTSKKGVFIHNLIGYSIPVGIILFFIAIGLLILKVLKKKK